MLAESPYISAAEAQPLEVSPAAACPQCFHCGTLCRAGVFELADKAFCCRGCQTVFEILSENGLTDFYQLSDSAGVKINATASEDQFKFLDEPAVRERLVDFADDKLTRVTFEIPSIHCIACVWLLENLFRLKPGIGQTQVNFPRKEVALSFDTAKVKLSEVVALLASLGYAPELKLSSLDSKLLNRVSRRLWVQLGLAGFAFGNIMLFSISSYLGLDTFAGPAFRSMVGIISLVLALPVVIYSAADYWRAAWTSLRQRLLNIDVPIAAGLVAIFAQSAYDVLSGTGEGYFDSLTGLIFFLLCGRLFQQKTYDRLAFDRDYRAFFPLAVTRKNPGRVAFRRDPNSTRIDGDAVERVPTGGEEQVSLAQLAVGDRLVIRNGELIPADARLVHGPALIDYSFVTGESEPVSKQEGDHLYAGGRQMGAAIEVEMVKAVSQSYLTSLWNQEAFRKEKRATLNQLTNTYSQRFTKIILVVAVGAALFWLYANPALALKSFASVLIVACPCALALAAPFALGTAQRVLGRRNVFLKNPYVLETLARVDAVVFDKTGTLTVPGAGTVKWIGPTSALTPALSPEERGKRSQVLGEIRAGGGSKASETNANDQLALEPERLLSPSLSSIPNGGEGGRGSGEEALQHSEGQSANVVSGEGQGEGRALSETEQGWLYSVTRHSTHPLAVRIGEVIGHNHYPENVRSFLETRGCGMEGSVDGHEIWMGTATWIASRGVKTASSSFSSSSSSSNKDADARTRTRTTTRTNEGSSVHVAIDGRYRGCFLLTSAVRPETEKLVSALRKNCEIALLSGDNEKQRWQFRELFKDAAQLHFNQSPVDKLDYVRQLQQGGRTVMMVGDGLNDAGALKQSDVGVAVVENVSAFSPASDVILAAGMVPRMANVLRYAKQSVWVVRAAFVISTLYNVVGVGIAASGRLSPVVCAILMPLSSISVVAFACGMATWLGRRQFRCSSRGAEMRIEEVNKASLLTSAATAGGVT
ncbi:MAG TPA: heavy metal translocating P-type ATPase metal-binding domain-containing protein [Verrucomicrobiae bacterium]|nr:heavy metal translocating P-type ATPase metal-binding domain-containing protein [Verrucomicrobiae bacterium]